MQDKMNELSVEELEAISGGVDWDKSICRIMFMSKGKRNFDKSSVDVPVGTIITITTEQATLNETRSTINCGGTMVHFSCPIGTKISFSLVFLHGDNGVVGGQILDENSVVQLNTNFALISTL